MATTDLKAGEFPRSWWTVGLLGVYAAGLALAPSLSVAAVLSLPLLVIPLLWWIIQTPDRWLWCFLFATLMLPPLPIALGDSGPHVAIGFAALGLFCGVVRLREWRIEKDRLALSLVVFFLILLCSSALAVFYSGADVAAGSLFRVLLFGISV